MQRNATVSETEQVGMGIAAECAVPIFRSTSGEVNRLSTCVDGIKTHTEYQIQEWTE